MDPYLILGIEQKDASDEGVRNRYLELVVQHPPHSDPVRFSLIEGAYQAIKTARLRAEWDVTGQFEQKETLTENILCLDRNLEKNPISAESMKLLIFEDDNSDSG